MPILLLLCLAGLNLPLVATADAPSRVTLLPGWQQADGTRMIGVRIDMDPGWKTYWRAPGGSGIPPQFDFSASDNVAGARVYWPAPKVFTAAGVESIGYGDRVVFPVALSPQATGPMTVDLKLFYGVCEEVCIPVDTRIALRIQGPEVAGTDQIRASLQTRAMDARRLGLSTANCTLSPSGDEFALDARFVFDRPMAKFRKVVFETGREDIYVDVTGVYASDGEVRVEGSLYNWSDGPLVLDRSALRISLIGEGRVVEVTGCPAG